MKWMSRTASSSVLQQPNWFAPYFCCENCRHTRCGGWWTRAAKCPSHTVTELFMKLAKECILTHNEIRFEIGSGEGLVWGACVSVSVLRVNSTFHNVEYFIIAFRFAVIKPSCIRSRPSGINGQMCRRYPVAPSPLLPQTRIQMPFEKLIQLSATSFYLVVLLVIAMRLTYR